jgi:group I intron endonuclease
MVGQRISQSIETGIVYAIRNSLNGKRYIGSTSNPTKRKKKHFADLRAGRHHSRILQNAFIKHGESLFVFEIIEHCLTISAREREQYYLTTYQPEYNVSLIASEKTRLGLKSTPEHCAHISASLKGRPGTNTGKTFSKSTRRKMSEAAKKQKRRTGWHHTKATKKKMRANRKGISSGTPSKATLRKRSRSLRLWHASMTPKAKNRRARRISQAKRSPARSTRCVICSAEIQYQPNGQYVPKTCGRRECLSELQRRNLSNRQREKSK